MFKFVRPVLFYGLLITPAMLAQTGATTGQEGSPAQAAAAAATPPPAPSPWTRKGIDIYLLGDAYADVNFNHPSNGLNQLYNFDDKANQGHLNLVKVSLEKASGVLGFRVDAGFGRTLTTISATDDAPEGFKYLEQMYLEVRPPNAHGLQVDFGKFVTSAGAEVIESNNNWNYSRSLLFALAIPYYHFGARATIPVTKTFTTGVQLVNGWNSVGVNNTLETVGLLGNFTFKKGTWANTYLTGPQKTGVIQSYRQVYDSVLVLNPNAKSNVYFNFDLGSDKVSGSNRQKWTGVAVAARYQLTNRFAVAPRIEFFNDMDGFSTGVSQTVKELTLTGEMKIHDGLITRLEYRRDWSDHPYYDRGANQMVAKSQSTLALGLVAFFGPKK